MVVDALKAVTTVKVVSSPYLTVTNNKEARLAVGDQIPYTTTSQTSNAGGAVTVTQEVDKRDTGIILKVTPQIRPDNSVTLDIAQEVSTPREETTAPRRARTRHLAALDRIPDHGGFGRDRAARRPHPGPLQQHQERDTGPRRCAGPRQPLQPTNTTQSSTELVVLITPRVVRGRTSLNT